MYANGNGCKHGGRFFILGTAKAARRVSCFQDANGGHTISSSGKDRLSAAGVFLHPRERLQTAGVSGWGVSSSNGNGHTISGGRFFIRSQLSGCKRQTRRAFLHPERYQQQPRRARLGHTISSSGAAFLGRSQLSGCKNKMFHGANSRKRLCTKGFPHI